MSRSADAPENRFPGFQALAQAPEWDPVTRGVVLSRLRPPESPRFFDAEQFACAAALISELLDLPEEFASELAGSIDGRLAERQTDGWHYDDMPTDAESWPGSLTLLDAEAERRHPGSTFAQLPGGDRRALLAEVKSDDARQWGHLVRTHIWDLWMRYACTAYYAHPRAWNEMGWPGPAYPRGYKNMGVDAREPFEVRDGRPDVDPVTDDR